MARPSTGAVSIKQAQKLDIKWMIDNNCVKENAEVSFELKWSEDGKMIGSAGFLFHFKGNDKYLEVSYHLSGEDYCYKVYVDMVPANIGTGAILYFICPVSGSRCRTLYRAYNYPYFVSQYAYPTLGKRLYYPCQMKGRCDKYNDRFWSIEKKLERNQKKRKADSYNGKTTKRKLWRLQMYRKLMLADEERWTKGLPRIIEKQGLQFL